MEIPTIVDYTDVKRFDMSEVPGFISGLQDLDNALDKFYMGSTTILTGTAGSGKTSLLSTLICQSVEQGFPVFVYSGELSNPTLKSWIDFVHAGQAGVIEYPKTVGSGSYYRVSSNALDKINRTYAGKVFFYKDTFDQKVSKVMSAAESVVRRYGVKTLIFDNMTSLDLECNDTNKWQKQEEFIRDVIAFGTRWNVCCIVVLHPKKMDMNRKMSLYDLSGVMASVNLSHRVFSLYRVSDKEKRGEKNQKTGVYFKEPIKYDVTLDVLKDRYGSGAGREIGLYYDVPSKRFFDTAETLGHRYEWAKDEPPGEDFPYGIPQFEAEAERDRQEQEWAGPHQPQ